MSYVGTDHRQIPPSGQPSEGNIQVWVDRSRHKLSSEVCVKSEEKLVASPLRVVFSELDAFLTSPQAHKWTSPMNQRSHLRAGLCAWCFGYFVSLCSINGTIWWMSLTPTCEDTGSSERLCDLSNTTRLVPGRTNLSTTAWLQHSKCLYQSSLSQFSFLRTLSGVR